MPLLDDERWEIRNMIQTFHDDKVLPLHKENQRAMEKMSGNLNRAAGAAALATVLIPIIVWFLSELSKK